jgi:hypothetical protein
LLGGALFGSFGFSTFATVTSVTSFGYGTVMLVAALGTCGLGSIGKRLSASTSKPALRDIASGRDEEVKPLLSVVAGSSGDGYGSKRGNTIN